MATYLVFGQMAPEESRPHWAHPDALDVIKKHGGAFDTLAAA